MRTLNINYITMLYEMFKIYQWILYLLLMLWFYQASKKDDIAGMIKFWIMSIIILQWIYN